MAVGAAITTRREVILPGNGAFNAVTKVAALAFTALIAGVMVIFCCMINAAHGGYMQKFAMFSRGLEMLGKSKLLAIAGTALGISIIGVGGGLFLAGIKRESKIVITSQPIETLDLTNVEATILNRS